MKDAIGGAMTIQIIVIFLVLINGYLAFNVNYTRAFRVKNEVISIIEKNEGATEGGSNLVNVTCTDNDMYNAICQIEKYLKEIGYTNQNIETLARKNCTNHGYEFKQGGYCLKATTVGTGGATNVDSYDPNYRGTVYSVITFVNIEIPVLNMIFENGAAFNVKGETKLIYSSGY